MTDDIVKRLRYGLIDTNTSYRYLQEAADEIEKLRAALKPFAELAEYYDGEPDAQPAWYRDYQPKVGELHAAKSALALGESDE